VFGYESIAPVNGMELTYEPSPNTHLWQRLS
jgi:hypothetical protein